MIRKSCPYYSKHSRQTVESRLFERLLNQNMVKILIYVIAMICVIYVI